MPVTSGTVNSIWPKIDTIPLIDHWNACTKFYVNRLKLLLCENYVKVKRNPNMLQLCLLLQNKIKNLKQKFSNIDMFTLKHLLLITCMLFYKRIPKCKLVNVK